MAVIMVTGACGIIGEKVCSGLLKKGHTVIAVDKQPSEYNAQKERYFFYQAEPTESDKYEKIFDKENIESVVHLACSADNDFGYTFTETEMEISRKCDEFIYKYAVQHDVRQFMLMSTTQVYATQKTREPINEEGDIKPITNYAKMKLASERAFATEIKNSKIMVGAIMRVAPVYMMNFYDNLTAKIIDQKTGRAFMYLKGDYGFQFCCVHNVSDFVICFVRDAESKNYTGIYNVCDTYVTKAVQIVNFMRIHHSLGAVLQREEPSGKDMIKNIIGKFKKNDEEKTNYRYLDIANILNTNMIDNKKALKISTFRWNIENTK